MRGELSRPGLHIHWWLSLFLSFSLIWSRWNEVLLISLLIRLTKQAQMQKFYLKIEGERRTRQGGPKEKKVVHEEGNGGGLPRRPSAWRSGERADEHIPEGPRIAFQKLEYYGPGLEMSQARWDEKRKKEHVQMPSCFLTVQDKLQNSNKKKKKKQ